MRRLLSVLLAAAMALCVTQDSAGDEARQLFDELYAKRIEQVQRSPGKDDDLSLARELLEAVGLAGSQADLIGMLCEGAYSLSANDVNGYDLALQAMQTLAEKVPARQAECAEKTLTVRNQQYLRSTGPKKAEGGAALVTAYMAAAEAMEQEKDFAAALDQARKAQAIAAALRLEQSGSIQEKVQQLSVRHALAANVKAMQARVSANPRDVSARNGLVRLLVVELDSPEEAAKWLDQEMDEQLRTYVSLAAKPLDETPAGACEELGQWYAGLAGSSGPAGKEVCLTRAVAYFQRYLDEAKPEGLARSKASLALGNLRGQLAKLPRSGSSPVTMRVLRVEHKAGLIKETTLKPGIRCVAFPPSGPAAVGGSYNRILAWNIETGATAELPSKGVDLSSVRISPDGQTLAGVWRASAAQSFLQTWSLKDGKALGAPTTLPGHVLALGFSRGAAYAVINAPGKVHVIYHGATQPGPTIEIGDPRGPSAAACSADMTRMALLSGRQNPAIYNLKTGKAAVEFDSRQINLSGGIWHVRMTPDGRHVLFGGRLGASLWDAESGKEVSRFEIEGLPGHGWVYSLEVSDNARRVLAQIAGNMGDERTLDVVVYDGQTGRAMISMPDMRKNIPVSLSPDGRFVLVADDTFMRLYGVPD